MARDDHNGPLSGHSIFASPSWAALEQALSAAVRKEKTGDALKPVVVMVGSHLAGRYLMRRLAREADGLMNVRFVTMRQMAEALGRSVLGREGGRSRLPGPCEDALLDHVLAHQKFSYLSALTEYAGFRSTLMSTLRDLRDAGLVPQLDGLLKRRDKNPKIRDLVSAASSYFKSYRGAFHDGAELFEAAAVNAGQFPALFRTGRLFIHGLYDFTAVQAAMVEAIARVAAISVMMPYGEARAYEYARQGIEWFTRILGVKPMNGEDEPGADKPALEIVAAPGQAREIEEIAGTILRCAEQGMAFSAMAVELRDEAAYLPRIEEMFARSRIPYYLANGPTQGHALGNFLSRLLALLPAPGAREFFRPEVMEFLGCGVLRFPGDEWTADQWRDYSIAAGVVAGRGDWDAKLGKLAASENYKDERAEIAEFRDYMIRLIERLGGFPFVKGFRESASRLAALLRELLREDVLALIADDLDALPEDAAALDGLGVECTPERFRMVVESWAPALDPEGGGRARFQEGAVTVGNIMALRGARFAAVFVPGLMGRSFPGPVREDPILLDAERAELEAAAGKANVLPRKGRRPAEDRLLFALLGQAALEKLVLTYARTDEDGLKERLPSPLLLEAASTARGRPMNYSMMAGKEGGVRRVPLSWTRAASRDPAVLSGRPALDQAEHLLRESAAAGMAVPSGALAIHPYIERGLRATAERKKPLTSPWLGRMADKNTLSTLKRFTKDNVFSAGQLEDYAKCPFLYFCKRVMRVEAPERPEDEGFDALKRGGLVHEVLRRFMERVADQKLWPLAARDKGKLTALMQNTFDESCGEWEREHAVSGPRQWQLEREALERELGSMLDSLIKAEKPGFRPAEFELAFGLGPKRSKGRRYSHPDPIRLGLPGRDSILLRGVIDRLDECREEREGVRTLDYKTGKFTFKKDEDLRSGTALQGGLYLIAAEQITGIEVDEFCDSGYVHVLGGEGKSKICEGSEEYLDRVRGAVKTILEGIRSGVFSPLPAKVHSKVCSDDCEYAELCGAGRKTLGERLDEDDPAVRSRGKLDEFK